ncbi:hypothetical protein LTR85_009949 [Meristemomyces frigidus]|nr:hypothetical protein LTR85_009949 [Meristemomyces frigidus]
MADERSVYIASLAPDQGEADISETFGEFGHVLYAYKYDGDLLEGRAMVRYGNRSDALAAVRGMDGELVNGETLRVGLSSDAASPDATHRGQGEYAGAAARRAALDARGPSPDYGGLSRSSSGSPDFPRGGRPLDNTAGARDLNGAREPQAGMNQQQQMQYRHRMAMLNQQRQQHTHPDYVHPPRNQGAASASRPAAGPPANPAARPQGMFGAPAPYPNHAAPPGNPGVPPAPHGRGVPAGNSAVRAEGRSGAGAPFGRGAPMGRGMPGGMGRGMPGGMPGAMPGRRPAAMPGGPPGGMGGGMPGGMADMMGGMPGMMGGMPGMVGGGMPGAMPGGMGRGTPAGMGRGMPGGVDQNGNMNCQDCEDSVAIVKAA